MSNLYCSQVQFDNRFDSRIISQLSTADDTSNRVTVNVDAALDDAASLLDSYISGRWTLSSDGTIPSILTRWVAIKALDNMFGRRTGMPDWIERELEWCDKWLEDITMGKAVIPTASRTQLPQLHDSESFTGRSRANIPGFDRRPSRTATDKLL